jgi:hypothetical protein
MARLNTQIDPSDVKWDAPDTSKVQWDEPKKSRSMFNHAQDAAAGMLRGAGSIGATLLTPLDAAARAIGVENDFIGRNDRREAMTQVLRDLGFDTDSLSFKGGKLTSEIAGTSGVPGLLAKGATALRAAPAVTEALRTGGFVTGQAPVTLAARAGDAALRAGAGATVGGASAGLVDPNDAGTGAVLGGVLPGAVKVAGETGRAVGGLIRKPDEAKATLARTAIEKYGLPLAPSDVSNNAMVKGARSFLDDVPLIGQIGKKNKEAIQQGFNKAVGETFDASAPKLTPEVMDAAKKRMGAEFDRIWGGNVLAYDGELFQGLQGLRDKARLHPQGDSARLASWLDDVESKMVQGQNGEMFMPGEIANRLQSKLRTEAEKASGFLKEDLTALRRELLSAFNRNVSPKEAAALSSNMRKYKAFKTVEPLILKSEAGVAGREVGDIPPALLPQRVVSQYGSASNSPFKDLSQIGSQFVADRTLRTGGGPRAMIQNSAIGASLGAGLYTDPLLSSLTIPGAIAAEKLLSSPAMGKRLAGVKGIDPLLLPLYRMAPVLAADQ